MADDSTTDDVNAGRTDMSDNAPARTEDVPAPEHAMTLAGTTAAPTLFENPGMPVHVHRMADTDPRAAKRAERQVAVMFILSMVGTLVFLVSYFAVDIDDSVFGPFIGHTLLQNLLLGCGLGFGMLFIGLGAVHWAKTLMPD